MVYFPARVCRQREKDTHRLHSGHRSKNLLEVHPLALGVAFRDEASLVLDEVAGGVALYFENPLEANRFVASRECRQLPGFVFSD